MKRLIILLLLLPLLLIGCGRQPKVGVCLSQPPAEWEQALRQTMGQAGFRVTVEDALADQADQTRQVEKLIADGVDVLVLQPVMTSQLETLKSLCGSTPVILLGEQPEALPEGWCYMGWQKADAGAVLRQSLNTMDLNADGKTAYALFTGPEDHLDAIAIRQALDGAGECLSSEPGDWSRQRGETRCGSLLSQWGKDMETVLCDDEELALGALDAIRAGGRTVGEDIFLVTVSHSKQARLLVRSGDLWAVACPDFWAQSQQITQAVLSLYRGDRTEPYQYGEYRLMTKENVEDYL